MKAKAWTEERWLTVGVSPSTGEIGSCDWRFSNVYDEEGGGESRGFRGMVYDHGIEGASEGSDSVTQVGQWFSRWFRHNFPSSDSLKTVSPDVSNGLYRVGAQKIMVGVSDHDIPGFGSTFSYSPPMWINVSLTCMSTHAEPASVTSVCHVLTYRGEGTACLWLQLWFPWWEMPQPRRCPKLQVLSSLSVLLHSPECFGRSSSYFSFYLCYCMGNPEFNNLMPASSEPTFMLLCAMNLQVGGQFPKLTWSSYSLVVVCVSKTTNGYCSVQKVVRNSSYHSTLKKSIFHRQSFSCLDSCYHCWSVQWCKKITLNCHYLKNVTIIKYTFSWLHFWYLGILICIHQRMVYFCHIHFCFLFSVSLKLRCNFYSTASIWKSRICLYLSCSYNRRKHKLVYSCIICLYYYLLFFLNLGNLIQEIFLKTI